MDRTSVASSRRAEMTAQTASGASANAQSSRTFPNILAPKTTAEATRGFRLQRDWSGNSASPAVASNNGAARGIAVQFRHPQAKQKRSNESRGMVFRTEYNLAFSLHVVERGSVPRTPVTANCRFCFHFCREKRQTTLVSGKRRDANSKIKAFQSPCRTDHLRSTCR
jgi:broad specificity polyphosphatase/5'/3'-nucleotidase SurE